VLLRNAKASHGLLWILLWVSNFAGILDWLVFEVFTELNLEEYCDVVSKGNKL
jgi:hypothetical protein